MDEINQCVKKLTKATTTTLVRHNAFLMAASEENNYNMERFYEKARKDLEKEDKEDEANSDYPLFTHYFLHTAYMYNSWHS